MSTYLGATLFNIWLFGFLVIGALLSTTLLKLGLLITDVHILRSNVIQSPCTSQDLRRTMKMVEEAICPIIVTMMGGCDVIKMAA